MFNRDFFPTPTHVIDIMLQDENLQGKTILEPSGGTGNIVDYIKARGGQVIACEKDKDLQKILQHKCKVIADDFLTVTSDQISHIDMIVMNPPFSADEKHILHAFEIAPDGCKIIALCNLSTVKDQYNRYRRQLNDRIDNYGSFIDLGDCFSTAERKTDVRVALVTLLKPGGEKSNEFEGFFLEEEPAEAGSYGIMPYNFIRDLVNRYVESIRIYDEQLETAVRLNNLTHDYFFPGKNEFAVSITSLSVPVKRNEFKKDMQKAAWNFIFQKMNMQKYATKGLREDINKFVEQQQHIPFTMRNIYRMLEIVIGTQSQRMDKALLEVFDKVTMHYDENRYNVEGWKTNSHYLLTEKFIMPHVVTFGFSGKISTGYYGWEEPVEDMQKALCYITGMDYGECTPFRSFVDRCQWGQWHSWGFFEIKCFKKGTVHFKFQNKDLWAKFNQHIARIKGYPLYEPKKQNAYQQRQTGRAQQEKGTTRKMQDIFDDAA